MLSKPHRVTVKEEDEDERPKTVQLASKIRKINQPLLLTLALY